MTRLQRGGRQLIDQILADLADLDGTSADLAAADDLLGGLPRHLIKFNPDLAADRLEDLRAMLDTHRRQVAARAEALRRRVRDELEPMLERNEQNVARAAVPAQVAALRHELAALAERVAAIETTTTRVVPFRRDGS